MSEKKAREFWVPEDFIYETASQCMLAHPEQAAQLMRDDSIRVKYDAIEQELLAARDALEFYAYNNPINDGGNLAEQALSRIDKFLEVKE